ncbi:MAG TPA: hypothetical protein DEA43_03110 [Candidatus Moranbacteria bacterium]|nr:hypothetical protein [Candidatus Moranbacteria bacterium]HBT45843.1 hypothetical protein [Candidatus Moranbacteria bacterium]
MKKVIAIYLIVAFVFNFIWEMSQVALYKLHFNGVLDLILVHLRATIGDVIILLVIYALISLILKDTRWILKNKILPLVLTSILGFIFAVVIEKYALLTWRWGYSELMPIVPFVGVGLSPVLQLTILAPLVSFVTRKLFGKSN